MFSTGSLEEDNKEMCNLFDLTDAYPPPRGLKRKSISCEFEDTCFPKKRISPFMNTPMEKKDLKKKILKLSIQKMKGINNAELCLRKSVLINNTMKRLHAELKREKRSVSYIKTPVYSACGVRRENICNVLNNNCLSGSFLVDDPFLRGHEDKITDDMTDTLVNNLENRLGLNITSVSGVKEVTQCGGNSNDVLANTDFYAQQSDKMASCVVNNRYSSCSYRPWDSSLSGFSETRKFVTGSVHICVSVT